MTALIRLDIFPESYIYPKDIRAVRDALQHKQLFVRRRTQALLCLESLLTRYGLEAPGALMKTQNWFSTGSNSKSI